jgi:hypothetical protein
VKGGIIGFIYFLGEHKFITGFIALSALVLVGTWRGKLFKTEK